jgi:hypothetical protein
VGYTALIRTELRFTMFGWTAAYRLHYGFQRPVSGSDLVAATQWSSELDQPNRYFGDAIGLLRSTHSKLVSVFGVEIATPNGLQHLLLTSDAVGYGGDDLDPVLSAGQSIQVEWTNASRGKGTQGRTFFPHFGGRSIESGSVDKMNVASVEIVNGVANDFAALTPAAIGAQMVTCRRIRGGSPVSPLDSEPVTGTRITRSEFSHVRLRVQRRLPFSPSP